MKDNLTAFVKAVNPNFKLQPHQEELLRLLEQARKEGRKLKIIIPIRGRAR